MPPVKPKFYNFLQILKGAANLAAPKNMTRVELHMWQRLADFLAMDTDKGVDSDTDMNMDMDMGHGHSQWTDHFQ